MNKKITKWFLNLFKRKSLSEKLIDKMFKIAGYKIGFEEIKNRKDNWFQQYTITSKQEDLWKVYCLKQIKKAYPTFTDKFIIIQYNMFNLKYGLKIKN